MKADISPRLNADAGSVFLLVEHRPRYGDGGARARSFTLKTPRQLDRAVVIFFSQLSEDARYIEFGHAGASGRRHPLRLHGESDEAVFSRESVRRISSLDRFVHCITTPGPIQRPYRIGDPHHGAGPIRIELFDPPGFSRRFFNRG